MQKTDVLLTEFDLIHAYTSVMRGLEKEATESQDRAYGGLLRAKRGKILELMAPYMVKLAWKKSGGDPRRLSFNDTTRFALPAHSDYLNKLPDLIKKSIQRKPLKVHVDLHVFIDKQLIMGIECKSYTENAMLKRILVDFHLLKNLYPDIICCLLQMESQLGGDYSEPLKKEKTGSPSTHTLMSYFSNVELYIITLLQGERKVDRPIYQHFKELHKECLDYAIENFKKLLEPFV